MTRRGRQYAASVAIVGCVTVLGLVTAGLGSSTVKRQPVAPPSSEAIAPPASSTAVQAQIEGRAVAATTSYPTNSSHASGGAASRADVPTSTLVAPLLGSASEPMFGFNLTTVGSPDMLGQQAASMNPRSVVRVGVNWAAMQPSCVTVGVSGCLEPGPIDWGALDAMFAGLHAHNVHVLGLLLDAPKWTWDLTECSFSGSSCADNPAQWPHPPADNPTALGYMGQFQAAVVQRYESRYPGMLVGWEVWNEENAQTWWKSSAGPDPARYTRMLCASYQAVHGAASSLPVLFGGLGNIFSTHDYQGNTFEGIGDFLDGAYKAGAANCFTAMALHPYSDNQGTPDEPNSPFLAGLSLVRQAEADHRDAGRSLWITEYGVYTGCESYWPGCAPATYSQQAHSLECSYQLLASMPDIKALFINAFYDSPSPGSQMTAEHWGLYEDPNTPKPAAQMFTKLFSIFGANVPRITACSDTYHWQG